MPTIHVELFAGRNHAQKAALAREITEACVRVLGGNPAAVDVIFRDVAPSDWATGGLLWSDKLKVEEGPASAASDSSSG
jgi:4-oxalocrotonate tautomerase